MSDRDNLLVSGYSFGSVQDAETARAEGRKIEYFKEKTKGRSPANLLALYDKLLDEKVFKTPVGYEYLRQLQIQLQQEGISKELIRPIPLYISFSYNAGEEIEKAAVKQRIRQSKTQKDKSGRLKLSIYINILLAVLVAAMFVITLKSDNPNILNYKKTIVNQYAAWEQELTRRENEVRKKEQELQLDAEASDENMETTGQ
ncbi:MAG: hypothetical protein J6C64_08290 [Lachnospiraceae bacterium]|nr:hypothetical protein [Lachnospiraceae bacterium]